MADQTITIPEMRQQLAEGLKGILAKHEASITELRVREQKLAKHELCPLCSGPLNGRCACLTEHPLQKNAIQGYASPGGISNQGAGLDSNTGMGSMGGGGTQPMGMAEKCASHGKVVKMGKCEACGKPMHKSPEGAGGLADTGALSKKAPPDSEKLVHKLKDEYGHDEKGKEKAFATAWAIHNGTVNHKAEAPMTKGMPSSSAAALAPKPPAPATSVAQANHELGGMKSIMRSPTVPGGAGAPKLTGLPSTPKRLNAMGRPSVAISGEITNAKAETAPEAKTTVGRGLDDKPVPGSKPPVAGKEVSADGSGGDIKKGASLKKDAMSYFEGMNKPSATGAKGVGGKQMVGAGGGDAAKPMTTPAKAGVGTAAGAPKAPLPMPTAKPSAPRPAGSPPPGAPKTAPAAAPTAAPAKKPLAAMGRISAPVKRDALDMAVGRGAPVKKPLMAMGRSASGGLAARFAAPGANAPRDALDIAAGRGGSPVSAPVSGAPAPMKEMVHPNIERDRLKADKAAAGVGLLNNIKAALGRGPAAAVDTAAEPAGQRGGPVASNRFHGTRPLQRGEADMTASKPIDHETCALCKRAEHPGMC